MVDERAKTAIYRFYKYVPQNKRPTDYNFSVCDHECNPKTIAKFKNEGDANLFLEARRNQYVETGE